MDAWIEGLHRMAWEESCFLPLALTLSLPPSHCPMRWIAASQVSVLKEEFHIYMLESGR